MLKIHGPKMDIFPWSVGDAAKLIHWISMF